MKLISFEKNNNICLGAIENDLIYDLHAINSKTNTVYQDISMNYPPENMKLVKQNSRSLIKFASMNINYI